MSLQSSRCIVCDQELRLNNNGLGITGGTMLAQSLLKLLDNSEQAGRPWKLKVKAYLCSQIGQIYYLMAF